MNRTRFLAGTAAVAAAAGSPRIARSASDAYDLDTPAGTLHGTALVPDGAARAPVVLLFSGSGPTDRDGNSPALPGSNDCMKLLAQGLLAKGIASVRFDKRGIGASAPALRDEASLTIDDYVADGVAWIAKLRADPRFARVVLAGHSEGALIATLAARKAKVDGLASLSGAGRPAPVIVREQLKPKLNAALYERADAILTSLEAKKTVADVPQELGPLFRPSVQPYLISWFAYDPAHEFGAVDAPRAIVWGTADVQVARADTNALTAAAPSAKLTLVDGMNHVLKHAPDTSSQSAVLAGYTNPALPVEPAVIAAVAALTPA